MGEQRALPKSLPIFKSRADFKIPTPNSNALPPRQGRAGLNYVTASGNFHQQVVRNQSGMMQELGSVKIKNLPVKRWGRYPYRKRAVLFLLPPPAIGEHVAIRLFLQAFMAQAKPREVALLGADAASDVYAGMPGVDIHPAWMAHDELRRFNVVIDLNDVPARREIEFWPVDMEAALHELFALPQPGITAVAPVPRHGRPLRIGILPLASSPMRTLPAGLILRLANSLANGLDGDGAEVEIVLNVQQNQSRFLRTALDAAAAELQYIEDSRSVADLLALIGEFDYAVYADSGPAHLSKLAGRPGAAIFTSAPSDLLLGRHRNLLPLQAQYSSEYCAAPCGLAKVRQSADGRSGCMGSLGVARADLPDIIESPNQDLVRHLLLETPIPCVAALSTQADTITAAVCADLQSRLL